MENTVGSQRCAGSARVTAILAFGAYAACSEGYALHSWAADALHVQTLICLAVVVALWQRRAWAPWFAIGVGLSGLVLDVAMLALFDRGSGSMLDTAGQVLLLLAALRTRDAAVPALEHRLSAGSPASIGWTFALTAGVLLPLGMAAFLPEYVGDCMSGPPIGLSDSWLLLVPLAVVASLRLLARMRTAGLLVLVCTCLASGGLALRELGAAHPATWAQPELTSLVHISVVVGQVFLLAALVPLAPALSRALFLRR
jgi:hypothetical protein